MGLLKKFGEEKFADLCELFSRGGASGNKLKMTLGLPVYVPFEIPQYSCYTCVRFAENVSTKEEDKIHI